MARAEDANLSLHALAGGWVSGESPDSGSYGTFADLVYGEGAARLDVIAGGNVRLLSSATPRSRSMGESWNDFGHSMAGIGREMGRGGRAIGPGIATPFHGFHAPPHPDQCQNSTTPTY